MVGEGAQRPGVIQGAPDEADPELLQLPDPPRRGRHVTLLLLFVTAVAAAAMAGALVQDATYAARAPVRPADLPDLRAVTASALAEASREGFVCAPGVLGVSGAIRFERAFESGSYRLSPVVGREDLWVELRLPDGAESGRYAPPTSFCGRLVPFASSGLRHRGLASAVARATARPLHEGAWLLIDGELPERARWAVGLVVLFTAFAVWNAISILRLLRRPGG